MCPSSFTRPHENPDSPGPEFLEEIEHHCNVDTVNAGAAAREVDANRGWELHNIRFHQPHAAAARCRFLCAGPEARSAWESSARVSLCASWRRSHFRFVAHAVACFTRPQRGCSRTDWSEQVRLIHTWYCTHRAQECDLDNDGSCQGLPAVINGSWGVMGQPLYASQDGQRLQPSLDGPSHSCTAWALQAALTPRSCTWACCWCTTS